MRESMNTEDYVGFVSEDLLSKGKIGLLYH